MPNPNSPSEPADRGTRPSDRRVTARRGGAGSLERLLEGAQSTFAEHGYRAASIQEICARSRVGIGTFYAHFTNKRQLLQRVCVERALLPTTSLTPAMLSDHGQLVASLRRVNDDRGAAGLLRAWYEAVLEEPEIARFHGRWRASTLEVLATTVAEAQQQAPSPGPRRDPSVVAWTIATLSREMAIHDRGGAPDMDALARLIAELVFGRVHSDEVAGSA
jgi:AcrR family transcriptional regulator